MPGVGVRTAARILLYVGEASQFPTAGHLAAYAGLAAVTRRSGTSIRGEFPARSGNKRLKRALFLSAFAALRSDPVSRAYYDRKRAQGKKHNAALICLSRRRDVLFAMLRDQEALPRTRPSTRPSRGLMRNIGTFPVASTASFKTLARRSRSRSLTVSDGTGPPSVVLTVSSTI